MLSNGGILKTSAFVSVKEGRDKEGRQAGRMRLTISQRLLQRGKSSRGERKHKKWKIKNDVKAKEVTSTWGVREPQRRKPPAGGAEFSLQPTFSSRLISFSLAHHLRPILH